MTYFEIHKRQQLALEFYISGVSSEYLNWPEIVRLHSIMIGHIMYDILDRRHKRFKAPHITRYSAVQILVHRWIPSTKGQ